jgi:hypothetical protein
MEALDIFRIAFRLQTLFFPADLYELVQILAQRGYAIQAQLGPPRPTPISLTGGVLNPMAAKDDFLLDVNTDRGLIGVTGPNPANLVSAIEEVIEIFRGHYAIQNKDYMFFEFTGQIRRSTGINPITSMTKISEGVQYIEKCNKVFGTQFGLRSVRLAPKGVPAESSNYFDLTIEPLLSASERIMVVSVIIRYTEFETLKQKLSSIGAQMQQAITELQN